MVHRYKPWMKTVAQIGLVSKGLVYSIFGALIFLATFSSTEQPVGLFEVIKYIINKGAVGRMLVLTMAFGLLSYSCWKFLQMVFNAEGYKKNLNGYFIRITWVGPFVFYLGLGTHGLVQLYNWYFGTFRYFEGKESDFNRLLESSWGETLIIVIAVGLLSNALTLFYLAATGKYKLLMSGREFFEYNPKAATMAGLIGYIGYGITLFILGALFFAATYYHDYSLAQGQESMFYYLLSKPFGKMLLSIVATGTVAYGLYFFMAAFYRWRDYSAK